MHILDKLGIRENAQSLARTIAEEWWDYSDVRLYSDTEEALKQLRKAGLRALLIDREARHEKG